MNDLELCKAIAEIEGEEVVIDGGELWTYIKPLASAVKTLCNVYNPLTDKALLWDLTVKYRVDIDWPNMEIYHVAIKGDHVFISVHYKDESELPRAILQAIVRAHADDK